MWEAIRGNQRRSWILVAAMGAILVLLGFVIGLSVHPRGGGWGVLGALAVWLGLWGAALLQGDDLFLGVVGAMRIEREDLPQLFNVVEEMTIAAGLGRKPEVYLVPDPVPNAFAVGLRKDRSAVAVTAGLLRLLNRDELQGVVAHEIGHLKNRDTAFMVLAGVMLGAIVLLSDLVRRWFFYGSRGSRRGGGRVGGGKGAGVVLLVALVLVLLSPLLARLLYFACSRRREYLADASAAQFTRYPEGLASALEKIAARAQGRGEGNRVLAPMYIVNPAAALVGLFSTHPPTEERIRILRSMGGGAGYADYEAAYRKVTRGTRGCIGRKTLSASGPVAARGPSVAPESREEAVGRAREVVDVLGRLDGLVRFSCACGMGIGIPMGFGGEAVPCPRCGVVNPVPRAQPARAPGDRPEEEAGPLRYQRKGKGWESFRCSCGCPVQIGPSFIAPFVACNGCGRRIEIVP